MRLEFLRSVSEHSLRLHMTLRRVTSITTNRHLLCLTTDHYDLVAAAFREAGKVLRRQRGVRVQDN